MRATLLGILLILAIQERADLTRPRPVDATVRSYEIVGISITTPAGIFTPPTGTYAAPPRVQGWNLTIRYVDNVGTEYVDVHTEGSNASQLIRELVLAPSPRSLPTRLLQHLITEGKIGPARIVGGK
jgi:hypothetical protein